MDVQSIFHHLKDVPNRLPWLDRLADQLQPLIHRFYHGRKGFNQQLENFLNGVWLGHPLHPVLTDIPVGAWTAAVTLDALETVSGSSAIGKGADIATALGVVTATGAATAGLTDWQHLRGEPRREGLLHALLNSMALSLFGASIAARLLRSRKLGRSLALWGYLAMFFGAFFGGDLVYRLKIGTKHSTNKEADSYVQVMDEADLPENQLTKVDVEGVPILLVRQGQTIYAIAERCSHMGGPLAQGKLMQDNTVVCPWHGSRFDLASGKVIDGPSAYNQVCYPARIYNQRVEVRRPTA